MAALPMASKVVAGPLRTFTVSLVMVSRASLAGAVVGVITWLAVAVTATVVVSATEEVIGVATVAVGVAGFTVGVGVGAAATVSGVGVKVGTRA